MQVCVCVFAMVLTRNLFGYLVICVWKMFKSFLGKGSSCLARICVCSKKVLGR